jgi:hypothetical protein
MVVVKKRVRMMAGRMVEKEKREYVRVRMRDDGWYDIKWRVVVGVRDSSI